jgi:lysophospholipase L1-like esterase
VRIIASEASQRRPRHIQSSLIGLSEADRLPGPKNLSQSGGTRYRLFFLTVALCFFSSFCAPPQRRTVIILCAGDSLTDSAYPRDLQRLLARDGIPARVLNFGRKGDTSGEYRRFLEDHRAALAGEHPDFILLQLGTNDVRLDADLTDTPAFARNMRAIIAGFRGFTDRRGGKASVLLASIPPVPESAAFPFGPASRERVVREINPALRDLAREEQLVFVDNYALFSASPELLPDVHPSREGYRRLARNWYSVLAPLLKK